MTDCGNKVVLTDEQERVLSVLMSGRNVFLTGEAGTGKSTVLREFRRRMEGRCIVLAPTGVAAVNVGGVTIHSFLQLKPGLLTLEVIEPFASAQKRQTLQKAKTIIVDEVSMVRSDLLSAIDIRLRGLASKENKALPFGGKQIVLVGDFYQLPPIVKGDVEREYLEKRLGGVYAFQTDLWVAAQFACVPLKTVHRQRGDLRFVSVLNALRNGRLDEAARVVNGFCLQEHNRKASPICLCTTNREVDAQNARAAARATGETRTFEGVFKGSFVQSDCPTDEEIRLSVGCRVMILANRQNEKGVAEYVNGDLGIVKEFVGEGDDAEVVVLLDSGREVVVERHEWQKLDYVLAEDPVSKVQRIEQKVVGSFRQMPLRLAYAVTIHKSQGLSLESVDLMLGSGCFCHGQLYTALSRCRSLVGLRISRPLAVKDMIVDQAVIDFYRGMPDASAIDARSYDVPPHYPEAMLYYLKQIYPEMPKKPTRQQAEFCFGGLIETHPDLVKLDIIAKTTGFNKYDAPVLEPILEDCRSGWGVKQEQLEVVTRLLRNYC